MLLKSLALSGGGSGANTSLSNLTSTAINVSLIAGSNNALDLGSTTYQWRDLYLAGVIKNSTGVIFDIAGAKKNLRIGPYAGAALVNGQYNILFGENAGKTLVDQSGEIAIGYNSLSSVTSGALICSIGYESCKLVTSAGRIVAIGYRALATTTTAGYTVAIGYGSSENSVTGKNITIGYLSGRNTGSSSAIYIGVSSGYSATGDLNVAMGYESLYRATGRYNTSVGSSTGVNLLSGSYNCYYGYNSGNYNETGGLNTYLGFTSGGVCLGGNNTFVGGHSGSKMTSTTESILIGCLSGYESPTTISNFIGIGYNVKPTAARQFVVGSADGYVNEGYFGSGVLVASPVHFRLQTCGGVGTNIAGANFTLAAGKGTGSGTPGALIFQTSTAESSGSTLQTLSEKMRIDGVGISFFGATPQAKNTGWTTPLNLSSVKTYDANSTSVEELADVLGTLIETVKAFGPIGA